MATVSSCPDTTQLQQLLDGRMPPGAEAAVVEHLNACPVCPQRLEQLAAGGFQLAESLQYAPDAPAANSAYWPAVNDLHRAADRTAVGADTTPDDDSPAIDFLTPSDEPGHLGRLSHYEVVNVIGRGGMGVVLKGFDTHLQRHVALKVMAPQLAGDDTARKRFCREARAAAAITHENVVAVHHVAHEEGGNLPFLVMQLVNGQSLEQRLEQGPLAVKEIIRIGAQVAAGLAAAHAHNLIHRDIKPDNILLETPGDRVKLTDFGLARAAEDVKLTASGLIAGTPAYMSPEQAKGEPLDQRSDLFSLGGVLYAMSTGRPPFEGASTFAVLRKITEEPPPPIETYNKELPGWVADVIEKLLAKDPAARYQSAQEVADLFRLQLARLESTEAPVLHDCPIRKRRLFYCRVAAAAIIAASGFAGAAFMVGWLWSDHAHPTQQAHDDGPSPALVGTLHGNAGPVRSVAYAPDGATLAMAIDDGTVKLWDPAAERVRATINAHKGSIWALAYAPDGSQFATASDDGLVKLWDATTGKERHALPHTSSVRTVAFAPDSKRVATGTRNGAVRIWDVAGGKEVASAAGHANAVVGVAFAPDGKTIASAGGDKVIKLWDAQTGLEQITLQGHTGGVYTVAFAPDSKTVASGGWDKSVKLWEVAGGTCVKTLPGHSQDVWGVAFGPHDLLATASEDHTVKLWDAARGVELATLKGHTGTAFAVAFSPDGRTLASGGRDGCVRLWDVKKAQAK